MADAFFKKASEYDSMRPLYSDISAAFIFHLYAQQLFNVAVRLKTRELAYHQHPKRLKARSFTLSLTEAVTLYLTFGIPEPVTYSDAVIANMNSHIHQQLT